MTVASYAQNVGIGTTEPRNKLQITGSILATTPTTSTNTVPTAGQTKTMVNNTTSTYNTADSTGRFYDPGGPGGNYLANMNSSVSFATGSQAIGVEITIESIQLGTGDSLFFYLDGYSYDIPLFAVGNNYTTTGKYFFNTNSILAVFKSNADASLGSGFSILFRWMYDNGSSVPAISSYVGNSFFFDVKRGSLRAGIWVEDTLPMGLGSTGMGRYNYASGDYATVIGYGASASGHTSIAMGLHTVASGASSIAFGRDAVASGVNASALGHGTIASGHNSSATGFFTTATGLASFASGAFTQSNGDYSFSSGYNAHADGDYSISIGNKTIAAAIRSTAIGDSCRATGISSTAIGWHNLASASYAMAFGENNEASGSASTVFGAFSRASGGTSIAMGSQSQAEGSVSVAIGLGTIAEGDYSVALGSITWAAGESSTAIGYSTYAGGNYSTAMGENTNATGDWSLATGYNCYATGDFTSAFGYQSNANGKFSTAIGLGTRSRGFASTVVGMYNNPVLGSSQTAVTSTTPLFIVGNGNDANDASNAMVVLKNGNVGIGTNGPGELLHVDGGNVRFNNTSGTTIAIQAGGVDKGFIQLSGNNLRIGTYGSNPTANFVIRTNGADQLTVFPSGNATLAGTLTQSSDARFKENIQQLSGSLRKLMQLNGYQYNWKPELKKDDRLQIGLIAQNVEKVFPELIATDDNGMKSVAYQNLVPVLIEAIKEQQKQIEAMQKEIDALKKHQ